MGFKTRYDAVVIGGGHNGLIAGAYLARAGQSVLLLERNPNLGGATQSRKIFPGFDARLSRYSYLVSLLPESIVDDLGLGFRCKPRSAASCTPYMREGVHKALLLSNLDHESSRAAIQSLAGGFDYQGYAKLLAMEQAFARSVWPSLLQPLKSRQHWKAALRGPLEREAWEAFVERPLGESIESLMTDDLLRGIVLTDSKIGLLTHPHDPTLLQNRCFILHVIGRGTGEWQVPIGGMGALVDALTASATEAGAEVVTDALAVEISTGNPRHTVVIRHRDREEAVDATRVLVNAGPHVLARLLGESYSPSSGDEGSVCKVNMLLRRLPHLKAQSIDPRQAFAGTLHIDETYSQMQESYVQAAAGNVPGLPPSEIYCHTLTDDSILAPDLQAAGYQTLTLFGLDMPYRLFEEGNSAVKQEVLHRYMAALNRILADPIEDCLARDENGNLCIEIKSPPDLEMELALNRGNIFHAAPSWFFTDDDDQVGAWGVETEYERIYKCGSSAARGGAVSGIPGRNAAQCIFDELRVSRPLAEV